MLVASDFRLDTDSSCLNVHRPKQNLGEASTAKGHGVEVLAEQLANSIRVTGGMQDEVVSGWFDVGWVDWLLQAGDDEEAGQAHHPGKGEVR